MAYASSTSIAGRGLVDRIVALKQTVVSSIRQRRVYERTVSELNALTDRELADLGICRLNISDLAREAAYGK